MRSAHALFACLLSHWITATGRLLGPTTCLPHKDGGIPLNALLMETESKLTGSNDQIMVVFANVPTGI